MTLPQVIELAKETKAKVVHDAGTLVLEYEDDYTIRRVIVSSIIVEDNRVVETIAGRRTIYRVSRYQLRQILSKALSAHINVEIVYK
jgi:hypothetical protein